MKRILVCLALFISLAGKAQIVDTAGLRSYINSRIITNGNRSITAQNLNDILNAYLNLWPNDSISVIKGSKYDTLYYLKRGKAISYNLIGGNSGWTTTPAGKYTFAGSGAFTDTLTATTMNIADSSNRVATTAWVKRRLSPIVYSGTYIPVVTVESGNVTIDQVLECTVMRIGNIVNVAGKIVVTVNDVNQAAFALSLPFPSTFLSEDDCSGTIGTLSTPGYNGGAIDGEEGTNLAVVIFQPGAVSNTAVIFQFTYTIK